MSWLFLTTQVSQTLSATGSAYAFLIVDGHLTCISLNTGQKVLRVNVGNTAPDDGNDVLITSD